MGLAQKRIWHLKSENPIYTMIKALLAKADRLLTCVDLIDDHELSQSPFFPAPPLKDRIPITINKMRDSVKIETDKFVIAHSRRKE